MEEASTQLPSACVSDDKDAWLEKRNSNCSFSPKRIQSHFKVSQLVCSITINVNVNGRAAGALNDQYVCALVH